jgi:hypothetical protein
MSSHALSVTGVLSASPPGSRPGGALERIEVRGSFMLTIKSPNPHPTLSLAKGEANISP